MFAWIGRENASSSLDRRPTGLKNTFISYLPHKNVNHKKCNSTYMLYKVYCILHELSGAYAMRLITMYIFTQNPLCKLFVGNLYTNNNTVVWTKKVNLTHTKEYEKLRSVIDRITARKPFLDRNRTKNSYLLSNSFYSDSCELTFLTYFISL